MELGLWLREWVPLVAALSPVATFVIATVAFMAYRQRVVADKRDQAWQRVQWAIEAALNDDDPQLRLTGLIVLTQVKQSKSATDEDRVLFDEIAAAIQDEMLFDLEDEEPDVLDVDANMEETEDADAVSGGDHSSAAKSESAGRNQQNEPDAR